jgi:hypothetical protein
MSKAPRPVAPTAGLGPDPARCDRQRVAKQLIEMGRHDLADLYEHCDRFYPSLSIPSDGTIYRTAESATAWLSGCGSPSATCLEG